MSEVPLSLRGVDGGLSLDGDRPARCHRMVIVGGGAAGLELATRLGNTLGRRGKAEITLIERERTHVWKPKLHEMDVPLALQDARTDAAWVFQGFARNPGALIVRRTAPRVKLH